MFRQAIFFAQEELSMTDYFVMEIMPLLVILFFAYYPASLITGLIHRLLVPSSATPEGSGLGDEVGPVWTWWVLFTLWGVFTSVFFFYWKTGAW